MLPAGRLRDYGDTKLQTKCGSSTTSPLTFEIDYIGCPFSRELNTKVCVLVYKCRHQAAPTYLAELCSPMSESANRGHLRSAARGDFQISNFTQIY